MSSTADSTIKKIDDDNKEMIKGNRDMFEKMFKDHQMLWDKYNEARNEISKLLAQNIEHVKRDGERYKLASETLEKANTLKKKDLLKILSQFL
jgi:hypothetical protein